MEAQLKECIVEILLPYQQEGLASCRELFGNWKEERLQLVEESQLNRQIEVGVERAKVKWRKRGYESGRRIATLEGKTGELDIGEIDKLKRGEVDRGKGFELILDSKLGLDKDLYKVLALSIYGKSKFRKLVFRCINKYMGMYEDRERNNFVPHWGELCNREKKWITSWYMQRALMHNRDLCFSSYELNIISMIYDVNIRVYAEDLQWLWKTSRKSSRVINILSGADNTWALLEFQSMKSQKIRIKNKYNSWGNNNNKVSWSTISSDADIQNRSNQSRTDSPIDRYKLVDSYTYSQFSQIDSDSQYSKISTQSGWSVIDSDNEDKLQNLSSNKVDNKQRQYEVVNLQKGGSVIDSEHSNIKLENNVDESRSKISRDDSIITDSVWSEITVDMESKVELEEIHQRVSNFYKDKEEVNRTKSSKLVDKDNLVDRYTYSQFSQIDSDSQYSIISTQSGWSVIDSDNEDKVQNSLNINRTDDKQNTNHYEIDNLQKGWSVIDSEHSSIKLGNNLDESRSRISIDGSNITNSDESDNTVDIESKLELEEIHRKVINFYKDKEGVSITHNSFDIKEGNYNKVTDCVDIVKTLVDKDSRVSCGDNHFPKISLYQDRSDDNIDSDQFKVDENRAHTQYKIQSREIIPQVVKNKGNLDWIIIATNTEELGELNNIVNNINRLGFLRGEQLNFSNITLTTDISRGSEEIALHDENSWVNPEVSDTNKAEVEYISNESYSSIEDDIKWLFVDKEEAEEHRDQESEGAEEERMAVSINSDNKRGRDNYTLIENNRIRKKNNKVSKRRKFWCKWRNKIRSKERNINRKEDRRLYKVGIQQKSMEAVFDYSSKGLDRTEIELLSKGSTFCIANNRIDEDRFKADIYAYSRRLRLHEEYKEQSADIDFSQLFSQILHNQNQSQVTDDNSQADRGTRKKTVSRRLPSMYDPESQNRNLARYVNCIQEESIVAINTKIKFKDNLSKEHRLALKTLKQKVEDRIIVITLADKGSGIVVVDYDKYVEKGTDYIEREAKAYSITNKPQKQIISDIVKERNKIVKKLREVGVIEVETATYCMKQLEEKVTGMKFYYKVHKDTKIDTMPLRPLQSCIGAPTQHLSQVLTDLLQPFLNSQFIPTFIQDSNQLLYRLESLGILDESSTLISSDVAALYPSIPHQEGLIAVETFLVESSSFNVSQIKYIMLALKLVITQNFVMWNGNIYSQDSGVAMGTPVAVAYANIFMHWIDTQIRQRAGFIIEHIRYIDDNLLIIPEDKIEQMMGIANTILVPHIRFTYEKLDKQSDVGLPFLDTQLLISNTRTIVSRLYTKKTDKHTYLLPSSFHPSHITKNIPQAVFNRIRRICSTIDWFRVDAAKTMQWLEDRGYSYADIVRAVENSSQKDRWEMINRIEENRGNRSVEDRHKEVEDIPLIVTYTHTGRLLKEVLKNRQPLLNASFNKTKVKPRLAYRRQRNINDLLIQRGLRKPIMGNIVEEYVLSQCGSKPKYRIPCPCKGNHDQSICRCCAHLRIKLDNIEVKLHKAVNCESRNVVYMLGCKLCKKLYIGETQQQLKERFLQHLNNIQKFSQPLYTYFNRVHKAENIFISVLETVRSNDHAYRKIREAWWINRLQTLEPKGFNIKLDCNQIYQEATSRVGRHRCSNLEQ